MTHACGCGCQEGKGAGATKVVTLGKPSRAVTAGQTVDEVARRWPRTLPVMQGLGINHCCGGHLTLDQAAASAGVPLETLLAELEKAAGAPA